MKQHECLSSEGPGKELRAARCPPVLPDAAAGSMARRDEDAAPPCGDAVSGNALSSHSDAIAARMWLFSRGGTWPFRSRQAACKRNTMLLATFSGKLLGTTSVARWTATGE